jgi:hypothetical protein
MSGGTMADVENVFLEHVRHIGGAVNGVRDDIREIKQRLGILESRYAGLSTRLDRVDGQIARIERGLELTDA